MTKPIVRIITGELVVDREMTDDEFTAYEQRQKDEATQTKANADALAAKNAVRQAVLDKLGLTADEAQALLG